MPRLLLALIALAPLLGACDHYPQDPRDTTRMVRESGKLRVGVLHNPPWTSVEDAQYSGREVELIEKFAAALGVAPEWQTFGMHEGFHAIETGEIDVLIGGLVKSTPYRKAGFTRPYTTTRSDDGRKRMHVVAVRRGENRFLVTLERFLANETGSAP